MAKETSSGHRSPQSGNVLKWRGQHVSCPTCQTVPLKVVYRFGLKCGRCPNGHTVTLPALVSYLRDLRG